MKLKALDLISNMVLGQAYVFFNLEINDIHYNFP